LALHDIRHPKRGVRSFEPSPPNASGVAAPAGVEELLATYNKMAVLWVRGLQVWVRRRERVPLRLVDAAIKR
jgi:hypothetical protein